MTPARPRSRAAGLARSLTPRKFQRQAGRHVASAFRLSRSWTQRDAATWAGVSERQWRRYESGASLVPVALFKRIAAEAVTP